MKRLFLSAAILIVCPAPAVTQTQGTWTYDSSKDEMTDELSFHIFRDSRPTYSTRGDLITGTLVWSCSADVGRQVFIMLHKYFAGDADDQVLVETRFDSAPPSESAWWHLLNKRGAVMPTEEISSFTDRVIRGKRLLVRVTDPLDGEAITYSFSLIGFTSAYRRLEPNCPSDDEARGAPVNALEHVKDSSEKIIPPTLDQVFTESVVDERPEMLTRPPLQYPEVLREAGVEGRVLVQAIIDTLGRAEPASVKVMQSPNPGFDQSAMQMVLKALFRPARLHGRAVRVLVNLPIDFTIKR